MSSEAQYARDPSSLTSIVKQFEDAGFTGQFVPREGGVLMCAGCREEHPATGFLMTALRRTEGASDPADMAAVVALTCPTCGHRGTAVLKYGPGASAEESDVLAALDDHRAGDGVIVDPDESPDRLTASANEPPAGSQAGT